jgi:hypothetical protein
MQAADARDFDSVRAAYDPEVVLDAHPSAAVDTGTFRGRRETLRWFDDWFGDAVVADWRIEVVDLWEPDDGVVLTRSRTSGRGRSSGVPLEGDSLYNGFVVRESRIVQISVAGNPRDALASLGRADLAGTVGEPPNQGASQ